MPGAGATGLAPFGGQDLSGAGAPGRPFKTPLKPGQLPGEESVDVSLWTVADVCGWLETLMLGQYKDSFADAAVDGPFLLELTEDDLLNTLGVEHALHRKKIIASILRLRKEVEQTQMKEAVREHAAIQQQIAQSGPSTAMVQMMGSPVMMGNGSPVSPMATQMMPGSPMMMGMASPGGMMMPMMTAGGMASPGGMMSPMMTMGGTMAPTAVAPGAEAKANTLGGVASLAVLDAQKAEAAALDKSRSKDAGLLKMDDLVSWIRHNKGKQVAEALAVLPDGRFKVEQIKTAYVPGFGTEYISALDGLAFHVNKTDEHGNTLLMVAAQNNRLKMAQLLIRKGANPNHQNAQGNTAMHFAMSYKFHDLAAWLVDPEKGGASDEVHNQHGLDPYEGLEP
jgi:SAM domain (Sterile alpha motif)/Ankyrin repeats (many copies)